MFLPQIILKIYGEKDADNRATNSLSIKVGSLNYSGSQFTQTFYVEDVLRPDLYYGGRTTNVPNGFGFSVDDRDSNDRKLPIGFVNQTKVIRCFTCMPFASRSLFLRATDGCPTRSGTRLMMEDILMSSQRSTT